MQAERRQDHQANIDRTTCQALPESGAAQSSILRDRALHAWAQRLLTAVTRGESLVLCVEGNTSLTRGLTERDSEFR